VNRERREIIYSICIIIAIPLLFAGNTLFITKRIRDNTNRNARSSADTVNTMIAEGIRSSVESKKYTETTTILKSMKERQPTIGSIYVVARDNNAFKIVAKTDDAPEVLTQNDTLQLSIIFDRARSAAKRIDGQNSSGEAVKGWNVISPLLVSNSTTVEAAVSTDVLTSDTEELIAKTLVTSFEITAVTAVIIVVLLFHHLRFVGYADLLRRQKELNQTMNDFLSVATHELKAPMAVIQGNISNILDGVFGKLPDAFIHPVNNVTLQTDRLNNLVQDLLNVSRIEQGRINFELKNVNTREIIDTMVRNYMGPAESKGIKLTYNPEGVADVYADEGRVQEIITNLIDNAIKYTPEGSVIITHRKEGNSLVTSVRDTGPGMTDVERGRLFQRFYRVKNEHTEGIPGTGLGLWIIKQYAEKMGGDITVSSIVGAGTEFTVILPLAKDAPQKPNT
jgi:signal transduction histidine kinase